MRYLSTRNQALRVSGAQAIVQGLSHDGGLFLPERIPALTPAQLCEMSGWSYARRAAFIMGLYLEQWSHEELLCAAQQAYGAEKFDTPEIAPLKRLSPDTCLMELWNGPTCAFKDMALQMLPQLLTASLRKTGEQKQVCILVATSGDTGKAALEGFRDVNGTKILVFYPENGVSQMQKLQMLTQEGANVSVCAVRGNFDDAQSGVKKIFSDAPLRDELAQKGYLLSSANSINWGRVLPQIVYYISAYCQLLHAGTIRMGQRVNFCVPTGNFGNILAAYYAKQMGLPVGRLICASNANHVLTEFIETGVYDRNRPFYRTSSPSMDILLSSNLERLLYLLSGSDEAVRGYMKQLNETGRYVLPQPLRERVQEHFFGGFCEDEASLETIGRVFRQTGYLLDPHTAVAYAVLEQYREKTKDDTLTVIASTASPFKFAPGVLHGLGNDDGCSEMQALKALSALSGWAVPAPLAALLQKPVRFDACTDKAQLHARVKEFLR